MMPRMITLICFLCLLSLSVDAQQWTVSPSYGLNLPMGDLSDRFGSAFSVGAETDYYLNRKWSIAGAYRFEFGSTVKEDVIAHLRDENGEIVNQDEALAEVFLRRRGQLFYTQLYRHFNLNNSSFFLSLGGGAGFWTHHIRLNDESQTLAQASELYRPLYDRRTAGLATVQSLALRKLDNEGRFNFYIALEAVQGFTKNQRDFNFPDLTADNDSRLDLQIGLRAGWIISIIGKRKEASGQKRDKEIYY